MEKVWSAPYFDMKQAGIDMEKGNVVEQFGAMANL